MKLLKLLALVLALSAWTGARAQTSTIDTRALDDQTLQQEMANPTPLVDAQQLDQWINQQMQVADENVVIDKAPPPHAPPPPPHHGAPHPMPPPPGGHFPFPHPPGHGHPLPPLPPPYLHLRCFAQDLSQRTFSASGWGVSANRLQERAVERCRAGNLLGFSCVAIGCRSTP